MEVTPIFYKYSLVHTIPCNQRERPFFASKVDIFKTVEKYVIMVTFTLPGQDALANIFNAFSVRASPLEIKHEVAF